MRGSVYFVLCDHSIKIGFSVDPPRRLKALATAAPAPLVVLAIVPGSIAFEKAVHAHLSEYRTRGEWFQDRHAVRELMGKIQSEGYAALGFLEPELTAAELAQATSLIEHAQRRVDLENAWSTLTGRMHDLVGKLENIQFACRLEGLASLQPGCLTKFICDVRITGPLLTEGLDIVEKANAQVGKLSALSEAIRETTNQMILAQAEGVVAFAERSIQDFFKFRDMWGKSDDAASGGLE